MQATDFNSREFLIDILNQIHNLNIKKSDELLSYHWKLNGL